MGQPRVGPQIARNWRSKGEAQDQRLTTMALTCNFPSRVPFHGAFYHHAHSLSLSLFYPSGNQDSEVQGLGQGHPDTRGGARVGTQCVRRS